VKVLLTGAGGFLGQYLLPHLPKDTITLGRGKENQIHADLSKEIPTLPQVDFVIHNAGLAHRVPKTEKEREIFFEVNVKGTENLLLGLDALPTKPQSIVFISTVAVYGLDHGFLISEDQIPKPTTPYGQSKWMAENLLNSYAEKNQINLIILRLPLVAGARKVPGNLGAMIKMIRRGIYIRIQGSNPQRSMVLAEDVGKLIPNLFNKTGTFNLTDGIHPSLMELEDYIAGYFEKKVYSLPFSWIEILGKIGDLLKFLPVNSYRVKKLTSSLTFDDSKARKCLNWNPLPVVGNLDLEKIESV